MMHQGSWSIFGIKLPDIGITEKIGDILKHPRTYQEGSNVLGPYPQVPAETSLQQTQPQQQPTTNQKTNKGTTDELLPMNMTNYIKRSEKKLMKLILN